MRSLAALDQGKDLNQENLRLKGDEAGSAVAKKKESKTVHNSDASEEEDQEQNRKSPSLHEEGNN